MSNIRPITAIVCDEIRMENNGKPFLIGIYTGSINLQVDEIPEDKDEIHNFQMSLWIPTEITQIGAAEVEVQIKTPNAKPILIKAKIVTEKLLMKGEMVPISMGPIPLKLWQDGEIEIQFKQPNEDNWSTIRTLPVIITKKSTVS